MSPYKRYLKVGEVAKILGVSPQTVRDYHQQDFLIPEVILDTGHRLYSREQVEEFINKKYMTIGVAARFIGVSKLYPLSRTF